MHPDVILFRVIWVGEDTDHGDGIFKKLMTVVYEAKEGITESEFVIIANAEHLCFIIIRAEKTKAGAGYFFLCT